MIFVGRLEGMSYEVLGIPIGTVRSRLSRGRNTLRRLVDLNEETESAHEAAQRRLAFRSDVTASSALVEDNSALQES
jgi:hypothetical protein